MRTDAAVSALQQCLALTYEAVFTYSALAADVVNDATDQDIAAKAFAEARRRRDALLVLLDRGGVTAVPPKPVYRLPEINDRTAAITVAQELANNSMSTFLRAVGPTVGPDREFVVEALREVAADALAWGLKPTPLPGT